MDARTCLRSFCLHSGISAQANSVRLKCSLVYYRWGQWGGSSLGLSPLLRLEPVCPFSTTLLRPASKKWKEGGWSFVRDGRGWTWPMVLQLSGRRCRTWATQLASGFVLSHGGGDAGGEHLRRGAIPEMCSWPQSWPRDRAARKPSPSSHRC